MTPLPDLRPTPSMVLMLVLALAGVLSSTQHLLASAQSPTVGCGIGNTYNLESAGDYLASSTGFVGGDKGIWGLGKLDSAPTNAVINLCTTSETCGNQGLDTQACLYGGPKAIALCAPGAGFSFQFINQSSPSLGAFLSCPPPNNEAAPLIGFVSCGPPAATVGFDALFTAQAPAPTPPPPGSPGQPVSSQAVTPAPPPPTTVAAAYYDFEVPLEIFCAKMPPS